MIYPALSDPELLDRMRKGDQGAFDVLYGRYHQPVWQRISKFIKRTDIAEELLQDVFMKLWDNRDIVDTQKSPQGWLLVVASNKSINCLKQKVYEELVAQSAIADLQVVDTPDDALFELQLKTLQHAIALLSPQKKAAFTLCKIQGKTYEEAARQLGISVNTVKDYIKSALRSLRHYVENKMPQEVLLLLIYLAT